MGVSGLFFSPAGCVTAEIAHFLCFFFLRKYSSVCSCRAGGEEPAVGLPAGAPRLRCRAPGPAERSRRSGWRGAGPAARSFPRPRGLALPGPGRGERPGAVRGVWGSVSAVCIGTSVRALEVPAAGFCRERRGQGGKACVCIYSVLLYVSGR